MSATRIDDPVLVRFRQEIGEAYGNRLERVVLFGSRARGDARLEPDYDIAVFIHEPDSFGGNCSPRPTAATADIDLVR